jgi:hypothetical protein
MLCRVLQALGKALDSGSVGVVNSVTFYGNYQK